MKPRASKPRRPCGSGLETAPILPDHRPPAGICGFEPDAAPLKIVLIVLAWLAWLACLAVARAEEADDLRRMEALYTQANELWVAGKLTESADAGTQSIDLARKLGPKAEDRLAIFLLSNAVTVKRTRGPAAAMAAINEALEIQERRFGPNDPRIGTALFQLSKATEELGRNDQAEAILRRLIAIYRTAGLSSEFSVGSTLLSLGLLLQKAGRKPEAFQSFLESAQTLLKFMPRQFAITLRAFMYGTEVGIEQGEYEQAAQLLDTCKTILDIARSRAAEFPEFKSQIPQIASELEQTWVKLYLAQDKYDEAVAAAERAIKLSEETYGADHWNITNALDSLASVRLKQQHWADYAAVLERKKDLYLRFLPSTAIDFASIWREIALGHYKAGKFPEAVAALDHAVSTAALPGNRDRLGPNKKYFIEDAYVHLRLAATDDETLKFKHAEAAFAAIQWSFRGQAARAVTQAIARSAAYPSIARLIRRRELMLADLQSVEQRQTAEFGRPMESRNERTVAALRFENAALTSQIEDIDQAMTIAAPNYSELADPKPISIATVRRNLKPDEALLVIASEDPGSSSRCRPTTSAGSISTTSSP